VFEDQMCLGMSEKNKMLMKLYIWYQSIYETTNEDECCSIGSGFVSVESHVLVFLFCGTSSIRHSFKSCIH
jgi:hypothetical protein